MAKKEIIHKKAKAFLRHYATRQRLSISPTERKRKSLRIHRRLLSSPSIKRSKTIALYMSFGSEVQTNSIIGALWKRKKTVLIPNTRKGFSKPTFVVIRPGDKLKKTRFGALEHAMKQKPFSFVQIDCVLVPGLSFDRCGTRIGYGSGVYDRLLKRAKKGRKIGLFFANQELGDLPKRPHDQQLNEIFTEKEKIRIS